MAELTIEGRAVHFADDGHGAPVWSCCIRAAWRRGSGIRSPANWRRAGAWCVPILGRGSLTRSAWPGERAFESTDDVALVEAVLREVTTSGPADLVGHSYGGFIALQAALRLPSLVRRIVVYEPVAFGAIYSLPDEAAMAEMAVAEGQAGFSDPEVGGSEAWLEKFVDFWNGPGAWRLLPSLARASFVQHGQQVFAEVRSLSADRTTHLRYAEITAPTLFIDGERSPPMEKRLCADLARAAAPRHAADDRRRRPHGTAHARRRGQPAHRRLPRYDQPSMTDRYIHGYNEAEARRLEEQAEFLAPWVFDRLSLDGVCDLLEVGVGVGAETRILRRRWPGLRVTGVDVSASQLAHAGRALAAEMTTGDVRLVQAAGDALPFADQSFDAAGFIWVLEHVPNPQALVSEAARCLKPGGFLFAREVYNTSAHTEPLEPAISRYFDALNDLQRQTGGHPELAARLPQLVERAGLEIVSFHFSPVLGDPRNITHRNVILTYFEGIFRSVEPQLRARHVLPEEAYGATWAAFERLRAHPDALFCYTFGRLEARRPRG